MLVKQWKGNVSGENEEYVTTHAHREALVFYPKNFHPNLEISTFQLEIPFLNLDISITILFIFFSSCGPNLYIPRQKQFRQVILFSSSADGTKHSGLILDGGQTPSEAPGGSTPCNNTACHTDAGVCVRGDPGSPGDTASTSLSLAAYCC